MFRVFLLAASCVLIVNPCCANNSYFIPGDAFFYCEIDQYEWKALQSGDLRILNYDRPEEMPIFFCGYAGYRKLDLSNLSDQFRNQLVKAISSVKQRFPTKMVEIDHGQPGLLAAPSGKEKKEIDKPRIFVCNNSFDYSKFRIGLKYNESWPDYAVQLGYGRDHFQYDFFVPTAEGIRESWRMASAVSPLKVKLPASTQDSLTTPIKIEPSEVTFLICPPVSLESLCFPTRDSKLECFAVSETTFKTLVNDRSKVRKSVWLESK